MTTQETLKKIEKSIKVTPSQWDGCVDVEWENQSACVSMCHIGMVAAWMVNRGAISFSDAIALIKARRFSSAMSFWLSLHERKANGMFEIKTFKNKRKLGKGERVPVFERGVFLVGNLEEEARSKAIDRALSAYLSGNRTEMSFQFKEIRKAEVRICNRHSHYNYFEESGTITVEHGA